MKTARTERKLSHRPVGLKCFVWLLLPTESQRQASSCLEQLHPLRRDGRDCQPSFKKGSVSTSTRCQLRLGCRYFHSTRKSVTKTKSIIFKCLLSQSIQLPHVSKLLATNANSMFGCLFLSNEKQLCDFILILTSMYMYLHKRQQRQLHNLNPTKCFA